MAISDEPILATDPFICPHVPHTPARCYRRDGTLIACAFEENIRVCTECHLPTDTIDRVK